MLLSIIIPVYNEEKTLETLLQRVIASDIGSLEKEIILVDDGSTDNSLSIAYAVQQSTDIALSVYTLETNQGKAAALWMGFKAATGDIYLVQDADLELDPNDYCDLLTPILNGETHVVFGSRFLGTNPGIPYRILLPNRVLTTLTNLLFNSNITDMETAYKVFRPHLLDGITLRYHRYNFEPEITAKFLRQNIQIVEVPVDYTPRLEDKRIGFKDGIGAIMTLLACRFQSD